MAKKAKSFTAFDGTMLLRLQPIGKGWYGVTCPDDPAIITEARSLEEAFVMAYDAADALARSRAKEKLEFSMTRKKKPA